MKRTVHAETKHPFAKHQRQRGERADDDVETPALERRPRRRVGEGSRIGRRKRADLEAGLAHGVEHGVERRGWDAGTGRRRDGGGGAPADGEAIGFEFDVGVGDRGDGLGGFADVAGAVLAAHAVHGELGGRGGRRRGETHWAENRGSDGASQ